MKVNGKDFPIYEMENNSHVPNHQPDNLSLSRWGVYGVVLCVWGGTPPIYAHFDQEHDNQPMDLGHPVFTPNLKKWFEGC